MRKRCERERKREKKKREAVLANLMVRTVNAGLQDQSSQCLCQLRGVVLGKIVWRGGQLRRATHRQQDLPMVIACEKQKLNIMIRGPAQRKKFATKNLSYLFAGTVCLVDEQRSAIRWVRIGQHVGKVRGLLRLMHNQIHGVSLKSHRGQSVSLHTTLCHLHDLQLASGPAASQSHTLSEGRKNEAKTTL